MSASVRQRLLNRARSERRPFSELLQYFAMERFLYRLSKSVHAERFVLKGALLLRVWRQPQSRVTMDIDLLGKTFSEESVIVSCVCWTRRGSICRSTSRSMDVSTQTDVRRTRGRGSGGVHLLADHDAAEQR